MSGTLQIFVRKGAGFNLMPRGEFLSIPLKDRIQMIVKNRVTFMSGTGTRIGPAEAIKALKAM